MPKVNEKYFVDKKNHIIDAAFRVCMKKPAYSVTMRDVVRECEISQGGIYRYFSDIDEIFVAMLNRYNDEINFGLDLQDIFQTKDEPIAVLQKIFAYMRSYFAKTSAHYGVLAYEINAIFLSDPERGIKISHCIKSNKINEDFSKMLIQFIRDNVENGKFKPKITIEKIAILIVLSFQGIERTLTFLSKSEARAEYEKLADGINLENMIQTLEETIVCLLSEH